MVVHTDSGKAPPYPLNTPMPKDTASLLSLIKFRRNPAYHLPPQPSTGFDENNIRWPIKPTKDKANASIQFAYTKCNVGMPLGIEQLYLKLGAHQQLVLSMNNLTANEVFLSMEPLPKEVSLKDISAADVLNNALAVLAYIARFIAVCGGQTDDRHGG